MIGKENQSEEVVIKVNDKRKFNLDGTLREGVVIEKSEPQRQEAKREESEAKSVKEEVKAEKKESTLFVSLLSTIAANIATTLGVSPHPVTGQKIVDLETGKYWIDILAMLKEKTKGNLEEEESELLEELLAESRMQYVQMLRLTEEKLKSQAAKKFSAKDVLGKRF
ncbi:MAG: DUF1844 domain-containing protein [Pyrinomonadaceae bacterium]|nr:DUF1844 domain-containing protein [Pyrinomonadaceae bacterium]MCX7640325.1 DUF1844 domain-containing protein [Pyrinomonadaceae bacterium]MDW8304752.1 DUF1844 domain-containing protein [Acidobacteriota bacterium]